MSSCTLLSQDKVLTLKVDIVIVFFGLSKPEREGLTSTKLATSAVPLPRGFKDTASSNAVEEDVGLAGAGTLDPGAVKRRHHKAFICL